MSETENHISLKLILAVISSTLLAFTGTVVETSMNIAFPSLMSEFNVTTSQVSWITTGYLLIVAILIPASAYLTHRFTLKQQFTTACIIFLAGTIICISAPNFIFLLAGRLLEGAGTGIAVPLTINIIMTQAPKTHQGTMIGISLLLTSSAPAVGPALGGLIMSVSSWRMVYIVLLPILAFSLICGSICIRSNILGRKISFDTRSFLLLAVCFTSFILGTTFTGSLGLTDYRILLLFAAAVITMVLFIISTMKSASPLIRLEIFKNKAFNFTLLSVFAIGFGNLACGFTIPNYAQMVLNMDVFSAGLLMIPGVLISAFLAPVFGRLYDKMGPKIPLTLSHIFICFAIFFFLVQANSLTAITFVIGFIFYGFGMGGNSPVITNSLQLLPDELSSDGNAVVNTLIQLSCAVGTAVVSSVVSASQQTLNDLKLGFAQGTSINLLIIMVVVILGAFGSVMMFRLRKKAG